MKKIALFLLVCIAVSALFLTSCSSKSIKVTVVGPDGNTICEQSVKLGEENVNSVEGVNTFATDFVEAALAQASIPYNVNKSDTSNYVLTNVGDIACDEYHTFALYIKAAGDKEFKKSNLPANYDYIDAGEEIMFKYEALK